MGWLSPFGVTRLSTRLAKSRTHPQRACDGATVELEWLERGGGAVCGELLATVPHWFGIPQANEEY
jgi:hypothetical protein